MRSAVIYRVANNLKYLVEASLHELVDPLRLHKFRRVNSHVVQVLDEAGTLVPVRQAIKQHVGKQSQYFFGVFCVSDQLPNNS